MKTSRGFVWLPVLLVILGVLVVSGGAYVFKHPGVLSSGPAQAAALTEAQISAILDLLKSFSAPAQTITQTDAALRGLPAPPTSSDGITTQAAPATTEVVPTPPSPVPQTVLSDTTALPEAPPCALNMALLDNCILQ